MRNYKRIFGGELNPTYSWSSYGDLRALKFFGFFILLMILPLIFWLMMQEAGRVNEFPKVSCGAESCRFDFENGTSKILPRDKVPFDENDVVIKDQVDSGVPVSVVIDSGVPVSVVKEKDSNT